MNSAKKLTHLVLAIMLLLFSVVSLNTTIVKAEGAVVINSATIQGDSVIVSVSGGATSEDGMYHLVASSACEAAPSGMDVAQQPVYGTTFTFPLNKGQVGTALYKKFTVCVILGGKLTPVSNSMYILNPEACA